MNRPSKLIFLPGALGRTELWLPVAQLLSHAGERIHFGWPGFGPTPADPNVRGLDDLVAKVIAEIDQPTALIAQSMGGVIAMRAALKRPDLVTHLVLSVTSGGVEMRGHGAQDWRPSLQAANPALPDWFLTDQEDLAPRLSALRMPTLLLWGDADPISPVSVGQHLASLLPHAKLNVFERGEHDLVSVFAADVAQLIDRHLAAGART